MKPLQLLCAAALCALSAAAGAQSLKPGLWEVTHKMQAGNARTDQAMAQMQQQLASMPPEKRKMMEEMMARQGVKLGTGAGGGMSVQVCVTKEMAERNEMPSQQGNCKTTTQPRTGNTLKMSFTCTSPPSSGEGQFTFSSPEAYSMKMAVNSQVRGKPETMNMEGSGKWLAADCGSVKPMTAPPKQ